MSEPISEEYIKHEAILLNFVKETKNGEWQALLEANGFVGLAPAIEYMLEHAYYYETL